MTKEERRIDLVAQAIYNTHWGPQKNGRYPPIWKDLHNETKEFIRAQARSAIAVNKEFKIEEPVS